MPRSRTARGKAKSTKPIEVTAVVAEPVEIRVWYESYWKFLQPHLVTITYLIAVVLFTSKRPDAIRNPQFWSEDGSSWYADAYNDGPLLPLFRPYAGYMHLLCRSIAGLSLLLDLVHVPLFMNVTAILIQALPAAFLVSSRVRSFVPDIRVQFVAAAVYCFLPHAWETQSNLTNAHWYLGFLLALILVSAPPTSRLWRTFDWLVLIFSSFSGPFSIFSIPLLAWRLFRYREDRFVLHTTFVVLAGAITQASFSVFGPPRVPPGPLGASWDNFVWLVGTQVSVGLFMGSHEIWKILGAPYITRAGQIGFAAMAVILVAGTIRATNQVRLLILFCMTVLAAALVRPFYGITQFSEVWPRMALGLDSNRYWVIPMLGLAAATLSLLRPWTRYLAAPFILAIFWAGIRDWNAPPFPDRAFPAYVERFRAAEKGELVEIPTPPDWRMKLRKR